MFIVVVVQVIALGRVEDPVDFLTGSGSGSFSFDRIPDPDPFQ